jgi:hypothetical protein
MFRLPASGFTERHLHYTQSAELVLGCLGQLLRDDPYSKRIRQRRPAPVLLIPREEQGVIMSPRHQPPRASADRAFSKSTVHLLRHDSGHRHGQ